MSVGLALVSSTRYWAASGVDVMLSGFGIGALPILESAPPYAVSASPMLRAVIHLRADLGGPATAIRWCRLQGPQEDTDGENAECRRQESFH
jgi:hypothetical protein